MEGDLEFEVAVDIKKTEKYFQEDTKEIHVRASVGSEAAMRVLRRRDKYEACRCERCHFKFLQAVWIYRASVTS